MGAGEGFDPATIERELGWAASIGMNSVRVFLYDLVWEADTRGFKARIDRFLAIASDVGIRTLFVLFDSPPDSGPPTFNSIVVEDVGAVT